MHDRLDQFRGDFARVTKRTIWIAFALSVLLHGAVLWEWLPRLNEMSLAKQASGKSSGPLIVQLAPEPTRTRSAPPEPAPAPSLPVEPSPRKRAVPPAAASRPAPRPPVIAQERPTVPVESPPVAPSTAAPALTPVEGDFYANLEARRRARGAPPADSSGDGAAKSPTSDDERERHNRIVAANLGLDRAPKYGRDPAGGGIFQLQRVGYDDAEFLFYGWNRDIRRNTKQTIEVRKGDNGDIRIAVVRKMIAIIRDHESGEFIWVSQRLGRNLTLSARPSENAGLEDFLMQEFFGTPPRPN